MTPEPYGLMFALAAAALLLAALGAVLIFKGAREESDPRPPALTDGGIRIGDGADVLRFRVEALPSGRQVFRAETLRTGRA